MAGDPPTERVGRPQPQGAAFRGGHARRRRGTGGARTRRRPGGARAVRSTAKAQETCRRRREARSRPGDAERADSAARPLQSAAPSGAQARQRAPVGGSANRARSPGLRTRERDRRVRAGRAQRARARPSRAGRAATAEHVTRSSPPATAAGRHRPRAPARRPCFARRDRVSPPSRPDCVSRRLKVCVPREISPGERRVALVPDVAAKLVEGGLRGASSSAAPASEARCRDAAYEEAGATIVAGAERALLARAGVVVKVRKPS